MNEKIFTLILVILAVLAVALLPADLVPNPTTLMTSAEIMTDRIIKIALLLSLIFALLHILRGTAWDFYKEIIDQHNIAGSIFVAAIILAIGLVLQR